LTLHQVVYGLVGLLLLYIAWQIIRYFQEGRRNVAPDVSSIDGESEAIHSQILGGDPERSFSSVFYDGSSAPIPTESEHRAEPHLSRSREPDASAFGFDALLEVRQMRVLLDQLRGEHESLRGEFSQLREEMIELRAASQVSPLYSEAVSLARRGYDVQVIAERCGISVAEAELVRSLSGDPTEKGGGDA
jgi:hypothetical protein